jgi:hypothetical protein
MSKKTGCRWSSGWLQTNRVLDEVLDEVVSGSTLCIYADHSYPPSYSPFAFLFFLRSRHWCKGYFANETRRPFSHINDRIVIDAYRPVTDVKIFFRSNDFGAAAQFAPTIPKISQGGSGCLDRVNFETSALRLTRGEGGLLSA